MPNQEILIFFFFSLKKEAANIAEPDSEPESGDYAPGHLGDNNRKVLMDDKVIFLVMKMYRLGVSYAATDSDEVRHYCSSSSTCC